MVLENIGEEEGGKAPAKTREEMCLTGPPRGRRGVEAGNQLGLLRLGRQQVRPARAPRPLPIRGSSSLLLRGNPHSESSGPLGYGWWVSFGAEESEKNGFCSMTPLWSHQTLSPFSNLVHLRTALASSSISLGSFLHRPCQRPRTLCVARRWHGPSHRFGGARHWQRWAGRSPARSPWGPGELQGAEPRQGRVGPGERAAHLPRAGRGEVGTKHPRGGGWSLWALLPVSS